MSQNHIEVQGKGGKVHLTMGYDRPLRQIFCNARPGSDDDTTDYSSLLFRGYANVAQLREALSEVGLNVPDTVYAAVEQDAEMQAGNILRRFDAEGQLQTS